jgi:hypothetical protein
VTETVSIMSSRTPLDLETDQHPKSGSGAEPPAIFLGRAGQTHVSGNQRD